MHGCINCMLFDIFIIYCSYGSFRFQKCCEHVTIIRWHGLQKTRIDQRYREDFSCNVDKRGNYWISQQCSDGHSIWCGKFGENEENWAREWWWQYKFGLMHHGFTSIYQPFFYIFLFLFLELSTFLFLV